MKIAGICAELFFIYLYFSILTMVAISPGALEFDPEKNSTKLIFSGYVQNSNRNNISKVPKFPPCAKLFTAIFQNGRRFGRK